MKYLRVRNWERFQHYNKRTPPWIKLHRDLLNDYEFSCLQDASKMHLMLIWLLASQMDNKIPADPQWIQRRTNTENAPDLNLLIDKGYLAMVQDDSNTLATCEQSATPETETETETETEKKPARKTRLPADWTPSQKLINYCKTKRPDLDPATTFENFRDYYLSHGKTMADWDLTCMRWIRNERKQQPANENRRQKFDREVREALASG